MKFMLLLIASTLTCSAVTEANAVKAIFGEAGQRSYQAQLVVASCIRNRGTLKGVYGLTNADAMSKRQMDIARQAWRESKTNRVTKCKFFGCATDAGYFESIGMHKVKTVDGITTWRK